MPQQQLDDALAQLGDCRADIPARNAARRGIHLQARTGAGCGLQHLLRSRRQQLHARIAATLGEPVSRDCRGTNRRSWRSIATEAGLTEKAIGYWLKAGQQAMRGRAMTEAVAQLRKGLGPLSSMPDGTARQEQELDLQIALGQALMADKGLRRAGAGRGIRPRAAALRAARPTAATVRLLYRAVVCIHVVRGELDQRATAMPRRCDEQGERSRISACASLRVRMPAGIRAITWQVYRCAHRTSKRASLSYDPAHRRFYTSYWPMTICVQLLVIFPCRLLCLGYIDQARLRTDEALAEAGNRPIRLQFGFCVGVAWMSDWCIED